MIPVAIEEGNAQADIAAPHLPQSLIATHVKVVVAYLLMERSLENTNQTVRFAQIICIVHPFAVRPQ